MKFLKWLLIIVLVIVAIFLVVALFLPSEYRLERSITINAPADVVYEQIADLKNWNNWGPWVKMEKEVDGSISEPSRGVGASMTWAGDTIGSGSIEVIKMEELKYMHSKLTFEGDMESIDIWEFKQVDGGIRATWANEGELSYPIGRFFGLFLEGMMGDMYVEGLESLKQYTESMPPPPAVEDDTEVEATEPAMAQ